MAFDLEFIAAVRMLLAFELDLSTARQLEPSMARCEQGYLCDVCGEEVESIRESDLYLHYVIGEVSSRALLTARERHIRCNPTEAQFIRHPDFPEVVVSGDFDRRILDSGYVDQRSELLTRAWLRLQELAELAQSVPISDYPLPEFRRHATSDSVPSHNAPPE